MTKRSTAHATFVIERNYAAAPAKVFDAFANPQSKAKWFDIKNNLAGYVVVQAESHDAAAKMFEGHPHFTIFPGDAVEIMECLPIPTR